MLLVGLVLVAMQEPVDGINKIISQPTRGKRTSDLVLLSRPV